MAASDRLDRIIAVAGLAFNVVPGNLNGLTVFIQKNIPVPLPQRVAKEIVTQSYLFFGYPQAIEASRIFSAAVGAVSPGDDSDDTKNEYQSENYRKRGQQLCRRIYHPNYDKLIGNMRTISPELADWMIVEGYGKVLSRPGPTDIEREIASIIFLTLSGYPVQLFSHVRGARNIGAFKEEVLTAVDSVKLSNKQSELIKSIIDEVF